MKFGIDGNSPIIGGDSDFKIKEIKIKIGKIVSREIKEIISRNLRDNQGKISSEEDITSRLTKFIEDAFDNKLIKGVHFSVKKKVFLKHTHEPVVGADMGGSISIIVGEKTLVHKGFLFQAKLAEARTDCLSLKIYGEDKERAIQQADKMIAFSKKGACFIFYTEAGFFVLGAGRVRAFLKKGTANKIPMALCSRIEEFYGRLFECTEGQRGQTFDDINEFGNRRESTLKSATEITAEYFNK